MSYDLGFLARADAVPSADAVEAYFRTNPCFTVTRLPGGRVEAAYHNLDTDVTCRFVFEPPAADVAPAPHEGYRPAGISFEVNYGRPTFFALEAFPMVAALADVFGLLLDDPQRGTIGPPDVDALVEAWRSANASALRSISVGASMPSMPEEYANRWWRQMMAKRYVADLLGDEPIFYPDIVVMRRPDNVVVTVIVWPDAIVQFLPACNYVYVGREGPNGQEAGLVRYDVCFDSIKRFLRLVETPYGSIPVIRDEMADSIPPIVAGYDLEPIDITECTRLIPAAYCNVPPSGP